MTDLIARIEQAAEGSRELDAEIAVAVLSRGQSVRLFGMRDDEPPVTTFQYPDGSLGTALRYTTSLDAALTLVPEGMQFEVTTCYGQPRGMVRVLDDDGECIGLVTGQAATPALALCAAALRARRIGESE